MKTVTFVQNKKNMPIRRHPLGEFPRHLHWIIPYFAANVFVDRIIYNHPIDWRSLVEARERQTRDRASGNSSSQENPVFHHHETTRREREEEEEEKEKEKDKEEKNKDEEEKKPKK
jgi:hypothetical protein